MLSADITMVETLRLFLGKGKDAAGPLQAGPFGDDRRKLDECGDHVQHEMPADQEQDGTESEGIADIGIEGMPRSADIEQQRNQVGYYFDSAEQWWDVVWWAGYRGFVSQVSEERFEQFKREHLDEVNALAGDDGIWFNVEVIHTIGEKA